MGRFYKSIFSIILFLASIVFVYYKTDCFIGDMEQKSINYKDYLYSDKKPWHILRINSSGNVVFKGKVILTESNNLPLNANTANAYSEIKTFLVAGHVKPKKGCNPNKPENGIYGLGCYTRSINEK